MNSTPTISSVNFKETDTVIKTGDLNMPVLSTDGIKLTSTEFNPLIDGTGTIYIMNDKTTIVLGTIATSYSGNATDITDLKVAGGSVKGTVNENAKGTIVVRVNNKGQSAPVGTKTIEVNVPAAK